MRVGVFDSGIGGLTVLKKLKEKYPLNDYIYVGDNLNVPYGIKSKKELLKLSIDIIEFLINKKVDVIVIACGTVSSNVYKELKEKYKIKIIDIITPTINYLKKSNYKNILVFATKATINSHIFKNNIENIKEEACVEFVPLIENDMIESIEMKNAIKKHMVECDIIVLGCTHYPLIKHIINQKTIDMADNIILDSNNGNGTINYYFSKIDDKLIKNVKMIMKEDVKCQNYQN